MGRSQKLVPEFEHNLEPLYYHHLQVIFAIREASTDSLIGVAGFHDITYEGGGKTSGAPPLSAVIGYWVAASHWGQGIATACAQRLCTIAFEEIGVKQIVAEVYIFNAGSARVLEKVSSCSSSILSHCEV